LQVYINGHNILAGQLKEKGIKFSMIDNAFDYNYNIRIEGSRIKHSMGKSSIKMYDKFSKILRIETTTNDVSFFKHYREVEHRNGEKSMQYAALKKKHLQPCSFDFALFSI